MKIDLTGKVALVTGGSRGIGRAIAERFGQSGARVVILARRREVIEETLAQLAAANGGGRFFGFECDVSDPDQVTHAFACLSKEVGGVDILVNNAGSSARRPIASVDRPFLVSDFELKLFPAVQLTQLVLAHMRAQRWGRILNITTVNGKAPKGGGAPTALSRAAGIALTKVLASELAPDNILVNTLCIGAILSDQWITFHQQEAPDLSFEDFVRKRTGDVPLGRIGKPEEVANIACFLASDAASYITGTAINVDGGRSPVV